MSGRILELCLGRPTRWSGAIVLIVACSLLAYRSIRVGNVSAMVGVCVGITLIDLLSHAGRCATGLLPGDSKAPKALESSGRTATGVGAACAMVLGGLLKYATPVLLPIHVKLGRWKPIATAGLIGLILFSATLAIAGFAPVREFLTVIVPTLSRSHPDRANQSLEGLLLRLTHADVLNASWKLLLRIAQWLNLLVILVMIFRVKRPHWTAATTCAASASLIAWLLIYSPLFWEHYPIYLAPLWGWLVWEAMQSKSRMVLAILAIALVWVPTQVVKSIVLPEPLNSHMLFSTMIVMGLAMARMSRRGELIVES